MNILTTILKTPQYSQALLFTVIVLIVAIIGIFIPLRWQSILTTPFSFRTFGIRKIRRWHSRTDTLGNIFLFLSIVFCILAPWIPYSPWIYLGWLIVTYICSLSRAIRMTAVTNKKIKRTIIFFTMLVFGIGLLSTMGFYNHYVLWIRSFFFANAIESRAAFDVMYYLNSVNPGAYLLQTLLLITPLFFLWRQFKYMRLENTYPARNVGFYIVKTILLCLFMAVFAIFGPTGLDNIYNVSPEQRISEEVKNKPMSREDAKAFEKELEERKPQEEENKPDQPSSQQSEIQVEPQPEEPAPNPEENPEVQPDPNAIPPETPVDPGIDPNNLADPNTAPVQV